MVAVRSLLARRHLALLICAAALLLRLLVPTGYMIGSEDGRPVVELCPSADAGARAMPAMPGMRGHMPGHGGPGDHGRPDAPCAFAGLSAASLGAVLPALLAALVAFVVAVPRCLRATPLPRRRDRRRPPLRGPPARL